MDDFNFELFKGRKGKYSTTVSISKPGILSFSSGMTRKYQLTDYKGAQLYLDISNKIIAIRLEKEETNHMFNISHRADKKGSFIACKSFITAHELEEYFGKRYTPKEIEHNELGKLLTIDLKESNN